MAHGLEIRDAGGSVTLSLTDRITRLVHSVVSASGQDGSVSLPYLLDKSSVEIALSLSGTSDAAVHDVYRSGTTIYWTARSGTNVPSAESLILVFAYT